MRLEAGEQFPGQIKIRVEFQGAFQVALGRPELALLKKLPGPRKMLFGQLFRRGRTMAVVHESIIRGRRPGVKAGPASRMEPRKRSFKKKFYSLARPGPIPAG